MKHPMEPLEGTVADAGEDPARPPAGLLWRTLERPGGVRLRLALAPARGGAPARGLVLGLPGRGQFIERWFETMRALQARGFAVAVLDHRGQGGSSRSLPGRQRHHIPDFALMTEDALAALAHARDALALAGPALLLGHSMGGLVALLAALRRPEDVSALLLAAPLVGLKTPLLPQPVICTIAGVHVRLGRASAYAWGQGPWRPPEADPAWHACRMALFTHDDARYRLEAEMIARNPALAVGGVTWGWLAAACRAMADLHRAAEMGGLSRPALFVLAGGERVVDNAAARRLARRLPAAEVVEIAGARHEILQEAAPFRAAFWRAVDAFLARHDL
ncbi:MAG: lysophospholipase [Rhodothalassiaceae bacterium]|nr:MAG: lysophospholipase [Rhodothalassiaceae bacterium]